VDVGLDVAELGQHACNGLRSIESEVTLIGGVLLTQRVTWSTSGRYSYLEGISSIPWCVS
jgi:hypothetical protein